MSNNSNPNAESNVHGLNFTIISTIVVIMCIWCVSMCMQYGVHVEGKSFLGWAVSAFMHDPSHWPSFMVWVCSFLTIKVVEH